MPQTTPTGVATPSSQPSPPPPGPREQWRLTPAPPYLPAAAVLPDALWPELPARAPAAASPAPPTQALLRQQRLAAEQGAT